MSVRSSTRPLRVLAVTHTGDAGGAESALLRLIRTMDPSRFAIECVTMASGPVVDRMREAGVAVHVLGGGDLTRVTRAEAGSLPRLTRNVTDTVRLAWELRRLLVRERPELVVANSLKAAVLLSLAAPAARVPWVWHLHDRLAPDYLPGTVAMLLRMIAWLGPRRVVANSRATADTLGRLPAHKVVLAYPGLEPAAFDAPRQIARLDGAVGIIGRVSSTKGQREFLAAAEAVAVDHPDTAFRIVGSALFEDAREEQSLRDASDRSPIASRVQWVGWVDDVARELRGLRMLVHASPVPEPFGQVVTEAMAARVPVIATGAGGVPEILDPERTAVVVADGVRRSETGILVRPGDPDALARAIVWVLEHPDECDAAAGRARESARRRFGIEMTQGKVSSAWEHSVRRRG